MEEIFEIIKAFNRLKEKITELIAKIDLLIKSPAPAVTDTINRVSTDDYVDEEGACRILHVCPRTLAKMRIEEAIPYIKFRKKILYKAADLHEYMKGRLKGLSG